MGAPAVRQRGLSCAGPEGPVKGGEAVKSGLPGYLGNGLVRLPQQASGFGYPKCSQAAVEGGAVGCLKQGGQPPAGEPQAVQRG